ncbi:hypothetical protein POSPLADRAFT_1103779, partial [Postia placenta MAD-698-R-SB12]
CPSVSSTSGREEVVQLGPTGPADVEDLLDLGGALLSFFPCGEGLKLDLAVDAGGDATQVPIPGTVRRTLEQHGELCGSAFFADRLVRTELHQLYLCCHLVVEITESSLEGGSEGYFVLKRGHDPLDTHLH